MQYHSVQSSFLTGVLDPRAKARVDTEAYNNALLVGSNVVPSHLGGVKRRPGLAHRDTLPGVLQRVSIGTWAPAGLTDGSQEAPGNVASTGSVATTTDPLVMFTADLGTPVTIHYADAIDIGVSAGSTTEVCVQYSTDNVAWTTLGAFFETVDDQNVRTFRRAGPATARYWRIAKIGGTDIGSVAFTLGEWILWEETATVSEGRDIAFEVNADERYQLVITDRTGTVFDDTGTLIARLPLPYASADIPALDADNDADILSIVHKDYAPRFVLQESATHFQTQAIVFDTVPQFDYADNDSPVPVTSVQVLVLSGSWTRGNTFQLTLDGASTGAIAYRGDSTADEQDAQCEDIARAVQGLYTVPGTTGVACTRTGANQYTVFFAEGSADAHPAMVGTPVIASGTIVVTRTAVGSPRTEDLWSAARGYPRCVAFHEGRLVLAGFRGKPNLLNMSRVGQITDMEPQEGLDDDPILVALIGRTDINGLFSGRQLQVFTSYAEMRFVKERGAPIVPGDAPSYQTGYGAARVKPVSLDGATVFVQRNRKSVRDFKYNYEEDAYDSLGVSAMAPHLLNGVVDLFAWNGSRIDEIGLVIAINGDGTAAVLNSRKEAQVQAWTAWSTDGLFKAGAAVGESMFFLVRRSVDGVDYLFLEQADPERYLDCSTRVTGSDLSTVTGLEHLNGEACGVRADGFVQSDVTPVGGSADLETAADDVEIGRNWSPVVTPMPLNTLMPGGLGPNFMRRRRIVKVRVKVNETLGLTINGRVIPDRNLDVDNFDAVAMPFTGNHALEESTNFDETEDKIVTFSQNGPLPFEILGVDVQMQASE